MLLAPLEMLMTTLSIPLRVFMVLISTMEEECFGLN